MLVFACITDSDNQGKVPSGSIIDRDNQAFLTTSLPTFPILPMIHPADQTDDRIKISI